MLVLAVGENIYRDRVKLPETEMMTLTPLQTDLISISSQLSFYGKVAASVLVLVMLSRFGFEKLETPTWKLEYDLSRLL